MIIHVYFCLYSLLFYSLSVYSLSIDLSVDGLIDNLVYLDLSTSSIETVVSISVYLCLYAMIRPCQPKLLQCSSIVSNDFCLFLQQLQKQLKPVSRKWMTNDNVSSC